MNIRFPIILLDPGHGIDTKGKCSPDAAKGLKDSPYYFREAVWCREVAQRTCDILQALGHTAWLLVKEENDIPLQTRVDRVNAYCRRYGAENVLLVSIHVDAAGNGDRWMTARGWSAHTTPGVTESDYLAAKLYASAEKVFSPPQKIRKYTAEPKVGHDFEKRLYILQHTECPAVLVENFFQDNRDDVQYLRSITGKGDCIEVLVDGITDYIRERLTRR